MAKLEKGTKIRKKTIMLVMAIANKIIEQIGLVKIVNESVEWDKAHWLLSPGALAKALVLSDAKRTRFDEAVDRTFSHGIVTIFIHYDNPNNIFPFGLIDYDEEYFSFARKPDINVFHYDYNAVQLNYCMQYLESGPAKSYDDIINGGYIPYFSNSSMSPVTAGFVAILKSINNTLSPSEYKDILIETSYSMHFNGGVADFEDTDVEHVVDIEKAVKYLQDNC